MKKLLFATAFAASAVAFADPTAITAVDFDGVDGYNPNQSNSHFFFDGDQTAMSSSVVTNGPAESSSTKRTNYFALSNNVNYLSLDTEGGTLWRSINAINSSTVEEVTTFSLGNARPVASTGTYLDTLVQFTVTEDEAPVVGSGDKLAIWLQAGEGTTNLMVRANYFEEAGSVICTPTNFVVDAGKDIVPGEWYRLTVKAVADVTKSSIDDPANAIVGFLIYIDNNPVVSETATFAQSYIANATDADWGWIEDGDTTTVPLLQSKTVFPSLEGMSNTATLQGVGFQGTGAVDEIVWTEDNPFPAQVVEFTLTYSGDSNVEALGAVTYTIGEDPAETVTFTEGSARIPEGASVTIAAPTYAEGYRLASLTTNTVAVADASFPFTFTMTEAMTVAITAEAIPVVTYALTIPDSSVAHATAVVTAGGTPVADLTAIVAGTEVLVTWTAVEGWEITAGGTQIITMNSNVTATAPTVQEIASADWVDDVSKITAGTKASEQYSSLAGTAVANADAKQLTIWAKEVAHVDFDDAADIKVEAFLLNCANTDEAIAEEKEEFVANITMVNGVPTVSAPAGKTYNGTLQLKGKVNLSDAEWTNVESASSTYKFYMYELSL